MAKFFKLPMVLAAGLTLVSCGPDHHKDRLVYRNNQDQWYVQNSTGDWFMYYMMYTSLNNNSKTYSSIPYTSSSYSSGGYWKPVTLPVGPTNPVTNGSVVKTEIQENKNGEPVQNPEEQIEADQENQAQETDVEPAPVTEEHVEQNSMEQSPNEQSSQETTSTTEDSSSGSSDSPD